MDIMTVFNAIIGIFGLYMIISALKMKKIGEIHSAVITKEEIDSCRDKTGFIAFMYWREALFGGVLCLWGIMGLIDAFVVTVGRTASFIQMLLFLAAFFWFQHGLGVARKKFVA